MIKLLLAAFSFSCLCMAAPRYGEDGGYQGYASYKPMTGLNALLMKTGLRYKEEKSYDNSKYGSRSKENSDSAEKGSPVENYSVPKSYEALRHIPKRPLEPSNNQLLESPASPYGHTALYGNSNGGYKIADVYSNDYSGSSYEEHDDYAHHHPQPYEYGYKVRDDHGNEQFKKEISDGQGKVKGSYGFTDEHGIFRKVDYVADKSGFHANVKTNEPGTDNQDPADVHIESTESKYD